MVEVKRRVFNVLAAVSLGLCIVALASWLRSFASDAILVESHRGRLLVISVDGESAQLVRRSLEAGTVEGFLSCLLSPPPLGWGDASGVHYPVPPQQVHFLGFWYVWGSNVPLITAEQNSVMVPSFWIAGVPYWFIVLLAAALPAYWIWVQRRIARKQAKRCASCGYDLRATPQRCPECGMVVKPTASPQGDAR
jgi:hypothetical protein